MGGQPKTALLFAGQGAQTVGMGRDLNSPLFARANAVLGRDLATICFDGPEPLLTQTDNAQPGIFVTSLACFEALRARVTNLPFDAVAGLSLGEFTALTAAGVLSFEDGLRLVQARGKFMQEACSATRGAMASLIALDEPTVAEVCREADVDIANLNCPGQIVISGEQPKVARAMELAKAKGAKKVILLDVAGAYHSRLMESARQKFAPLLAGVTFRPGNCLVVHNVTARPANRPEELADLLTRQVTGSVRWADSMQWLLDQGFTRFIELGPGKVLSGLMKRISRNIQMLSVGDIPSLEETVAALQ